MVQWLKLSTSLLGPQIPSLVGELRSHMLKKDNNKRMPSLGHADLPTLL